VTGVDADVATRRRYDSPVRRQRAAETRDRIVIAAVELLQGTASWNWRAVTVRAVAERAEVNERTVYRHFDNERALRDAVLARIEEEVDVEPESFTLDTLPEATARIYQYVSSIPLKGRPPADATVESITRRQREGLHAAVTRAVPDWDDRDQTVAAAMLDILLSVTAYERLVVEWGLQPVDAVAGIAWAMDLVETAVREGRRPERGDA